jgi:hypothetical protein
MKNANFSPLAKSAFLSSHVDSIFNAENGGVIRFALRPTPEEIQPI